MLVAIPDPLGVPVFNDKSFVEVSEYNDNACGGFVVPIHTFPVDVITMRSIPPLVFHKKPDGEAICNFALKDVDVEPVEGVPL